MKILIIGGLGYVGTALIAELSQPDFRHDITVDVLDRNADPRLLSVVRDQFDTFIAADILDLGMDEMSRLLKPYDFVVMLAGEVRAEQSIERPDEIWHANYHAPIAVYSSMTTEQQLIFPSTANVFGGTVPTAMPNSGWTERHVANPRYPYAETKKSVEEYLDAGNGKGKPAWTVLRFGTCIGWSPGIRLNLVTNKFAMLAMTGKPLQLHGGGVNVRPYCAVQDAARAIRHAIEALPGNQIYHVSPGAMTIRELAETTVELTGSTSEIVDVARSIPFESYRVDSSKIIREGFKFRHDLESAILSTVERMPLIQYEI